MNLIIFKNNESNIKLKEQIRRMTFLIKCVNEKIDI